LRASCDAGKSRKVYKEPRPLSLSISVRKPAKVQIYNIYLILKIAGKPGWWLILFFIPIVGFIVMILVTVDLAKNFGKGVGFALGLIFLGFIFYPVLGFSDAQYQPQGR
jgi:hypothetical protein